MSSLATILASPASGVSEAVAGYPIGRGDGVNSVFTVPPEITAISTLYRRDWQGTVALSPSPRTNLQLQSGDLSSAIHVKTDLTTPSSITAPDGVGNAYLVCPTATNGVHYFSQPQTFSAVPYTRSLYIKSNGYRWLRIAISDKICSFDCLAGVVSQVSGCTTEVEILGNGWFKLWIYATPAAGVAGVPVSINNADSLSSLTYAGDGSSGVYIWGDDLKVGGRSSYIPTTTAPVTVTDYALSGSTLTLAEAPAFAAELTVDGTGVNLPLLQIGG